MILRNPEALYDAAKVALGLGPPKPRVVRRGKTYDG